ncbi:MAG: AAA family ATPase [Sediminibacterium sp.]|nr:AAA family ATPase [Sediminibacterium sp.]
MFRRALIDALASWAKKTNRKPLIIRGARQVGKTTLVKQFSVNFKQYIYLNLENATDRQLFQDFEETSQLIEAIFFQKNQLLEFKHQTLLFIDEIQALPKAVKMLRYFFENEPGIAVIAAGSMLETLFDKEQSFPVGRVEYMVLRPVSFAEFLEAMGEHKALAQLQKIPIAPFANKKLFQLFHIYATIGGMPEVVAHYAKHKDITALSSIYDALITAYLDDVEKYASGTTQVMHIRHAIKSCFLEAGKRIKFQGFGNSLYKSREMGESLRILEKAMLIYLIYPNTVALLPLLPDVKKSPRLQVLDTGMLNHFCGIQKEILGKQDLNEAYQGIVIEHLVGQELLTLKYSMLSSLQYWVREKNTSSAEVDFIYLFDGKLIPVEVKSGATGKMKSLQLYMDMTPHDIAIRFYAGEINLTHATTPEGKHYKLLSLPYYLVSQIEHYIQWIS